MMTNEEYIQRFKHENVRTLALKKAEEGVDVKWCLQQIEGWQKAQDKLPRWAETEGLWYPPVLSMEQCSSEHTAQYKASIVSRILPKSADRHSFADLTGGYGIDFSYISSLFTHSSYVEQNQNLCDIATHNFEVMQLSGVQVICADSTEYLQKELDPLSLIFIDPARRDDVGRKTVAIGDCTPNVCDIQEKLFEKTRYVLIKLSPMLDINLALTALHHVCEIHVVSVRGECKELLFLLDKEYGGMPVYYASNLESNDPDFSCTHEQKKSLYQSSLTNNLPNLIGEYLFEPNASILKAGIQDVLCEKYSVTKLHPQSNLFTSLIPIDGFPGRSFRIVDYCGFGKKELRQMLSGISQANISIRNFPTSVAELRKKLKLNDGGDVYLFASTLADGKHVLIRCQK